MEIHIIACSGLTSGSLVQKSLANVASAEKAIFLDVIRGRVMSVRILKDRVLRTTFAVDQREEVKCPS